MPETMGRPCGYTNCRGPGTPLGRRLTWGNRLIKLIARNRMRIVEVIHGRRLGGGSSCALGRRARAALPCAISLLFLLTATPSGAADADRRRSDDSQTSAGTNYRVGAGDLLNIEVVGRKDLSAQYSVGQDGVLFMPLTGGVPAEGKTANELSAELARRLSLYDRDITQVNVSVAEFRSRKIFVLGAVLHPGRISFAQLPNVWDAISEAGGPTEDANLSAVEIIPSDQTAGRSTQTVDVAAAIREGRVRNLERLRAGDTVRVPKGLAGSTPGATSNSVFMFGAITRPGPIPVSGQL